MNVDVAFPVGASDFNILREEILRFNDTLTGSRWTPPLDRDGHAVATVINYTCRFEVR